MLQKIRLIILTSLTILLTACSDTIDYMVVGTGTHKGNEIAISPLIFDNSWQAMGGRPTCCWGWATGAHGVYGRPAPYSAQVEWYDYDQKIRYGGTMQLSEKLYDYATDLPNYRVIHSGRVERNPHPYFIFGFGENGEVVAWISNAASDQNIEGRVMHEVGRIQAEVLTPPSEASDSPKEETATDTTSVSAE